MANRDTSLELFLSCTGTENVLETFPLQWISQAWQATRLCSGKKSLKKSRKESQLLESCSGHRGRNISNCWGFFACYSFLQCLRKFEASIVLGPKYPRQPPTPPLRRLYRASICENVVPVGRVKFVPACYSQLLLNNQIRPRWVLPRPLIRISASNSKLWRSPRRDLSRFGEPKRSYGEDLSRLPGLPYLPR